MGRKRKAIGTAVAAAVGAGVAVAVLPVVFSAMGFTAAGIVPGSVAAKVMSAAATTNSGTVAVLQSIGTVLLAPKLSMA